jgi:hypothetical protein
LPPSRVSQPSFSSASAAPASAEDRYIAVRDAAIEKISKLYDDNKFDDAAQKDEDAVRVDLLAQMSAIMAEPTYQQSLIEGGFEPTIDSSPEKFRQSLAADVALWAPVVKSLGLKLD